MIQTKEMEEFYICADCAKDKFLKNYILHHATATAACTICGAEKAVAEIGKDRALSQFSRFLIKYHWNEPFYNRHWGGDELPIPFYAENPIISHEFKDLKNREDEIEGFLMELFLYNDKDAYYALYAGHMEDGGRLMYPEAIKDAKSKIWQKYKHELSTINHFLIEKEAESVFKNLLHDLSRTIKKNMVFWRARIGYREIEETQKWNTVTKKVAYEKKEIAAPPVTIATAGRANREGISFLYLSSEASTAVAELRPHPGHYVSTAQFKSNKNLQVADLRFIDLFPYFNTDQGVEDFKVLNALSAELSSPIPPEHRNSYSVTQFISDIIRKIGFDGILFRSSISSGDNLVVFNPADFSYIPKSSELVKVKALEYRIDKVSYERDYFFDQLKEIDS